MKRIISLLLTLSLMLSCVSSVSAADIEFDIGIEEENSVIDNGSDDIVESNDSPVQSDSSITEELTFEEFSDNLTEMIIEYDDSNKSDINMTTGIISDSADLLYSSVTDSSETEPTNRLIVKSSVEIDKLNSVACVSGYDDLYILQFETYEDSIVALEYYSSLDYVDYVQEDGYFGESVIETNDEVFTESTVNYSSQYQSDYFGYSDAKANMATGRVVIAVIDSGVQHDHERLVGRVEPTGFDAINNESSYDTRGHGTHVAGIIAANTKNNVVIKPYKVLNDNGEGTDTQVYLGIQAAIEDDVDIINLSLTKKGNSEILREAVRDAYDAGITIVCAAGNNNDNLQNTTYSPASFTEVICAVSVDTTRYKASTSNWGSTKDLSAPGVNILSCYLNNTYKVMSGTSMAAPFISCAAAYLLAYDNTLSPDQIYTSLYNSTVRGGGTHNIRYVTPGALIRNTTVTSKPVFEIESGEYAGYLNIILSCPTPGAEILYKTSDMPDGTYKSYSEPFRIDQSETITAYAISAGNKDSSFATAKYTKSDIDSSAFIVDENGTLVGFTGTEDVVSVPQYCNGAVVKSVASTAFSGNEIIREVTFSKYLLTIEDNAFDGCTSLEKVVAPGVTTVYSDSFNGCTNLTSVNLSSLNKIPDELFMGLTKLVDINLSALKTIGKRAFYNCTSIETIKAPSLTTIDESAFENSGIETLTATNLSSIGYMAFYKSNLNTATYNYVTYIGEYAFGDCKKLVGANFNNLTTLESRYVFRNCEALTNVSMSKLTVLPAYTFYNCPLLTSVTLSSLESVGSYAFYGTGLETVSLPVVTTLAEASFSNCASLETVKLPKLRTFNPNYFYGCDGVKTLNVVGAINIEITDKTVAECLPNLSSFSLAAFGGTIPAYAFDNCTELSEFTFGQTTGIGDYAFRNTGLKKIENNFIDVIGVGAFNNIEALTSVVLPKLDTFDPAVFNGCVNLQELDIFSADISISEGMKMVDYLPGLEYFSATHFETIPDYFFKDHQSIKTVDMINVTKIGTEAFMNSTVEQPNFDATTVGDRAFANCTRLTYVDLPSLKKIDTNIFEGSEAYIYEMGLNGICEVYEADSDTFNFSKFTNLSLINLSSLTVIPKEAFKGCSSLETIFIGKVTKVCDSAFEGCSSLSEINIPLVTSVGKRAFAGCTGLESFHADGITSVDENLFNGCTGLKSLSLDSVVFLPVDENGVFNMAGIDNLESFSADSISAIPNNFLRGYDKLKSVSFASARSVGDYAFYGTSIESFDFNLFLISIGDYAFAGTNIKEVYSSNYLEYIGDYAFADCKNLTTVNLYPTEEIGEYAFSNCTALKTFRTSAISEPEYLPVNAFSGCTGLLSMTFDVIEYLPIDEDGNTYISSTPYLEEFIAGNITEIPDNYFMGKDLDYIECQSLTHIGNNAFRDSSISVVSFPQLQTIGDYAFYNSSLDEATFDYVTSVGNYAFAECDELQTILFMSDKITLGEGAFMNDEVLWKIRIPSLTSISEKCFKNCTELSEIYVNRTSSPVSLKGLGNEAFYNCSSLASSEIDITHVKILGDNCFKGTLIQVNDQMADADLILSDLKYIGEGVFDGMNVGTISLENVETVLSIPSAYYVLIGSDIDVFDVPYVDTTVFAPSYTVVSDGCLSAGIPYKALDSDESFLTDVEDEVDPIDGELFFEAVGFDLTYQWYGCNSEDRTDSVLIYQTQDAEENFFVPLDYLYNDYDEYDYRYYYCVAISVENGNVVYIKSGLSSNTYVQITGTEATTVDYNNGIIFTNSINNINNTDSIFSALGENIEIIPSQDYTSMKSYGTGTKVRVMAVDIDDEVIKEYVLVVYGDVNGDGVVDALDAHRIALYTNNSGDFDNRYYKTAADLNGSDSINVEDYQAVINKVIA